MRIGVVADLMAFGVFAVNDTGIIIGVDTHHEKRGRDALCLQDVENARRVVGMGTVVKRQAENFAGRFATVLHHIRRRVLRVAFAVVAIGIRRIRDHARARVRGFRDFKNLAFTLRTRSLLAGFETVEFRAFEVVRRPCFALEHFPQTGILRAKAPEPHAAEVLIAHRDHLIERGDGIEKP